VHDGYGSLSISPQRSDAADPLAPKVTVTYRAAARTGAFASGCVASIARNFATTSGCPAARFFVSAGSAT
jgi:hypothetical protein